ncbi:MAG: EF-hand domain-containing protein [Desulfovibrio sp.]|jgi:hypothetical protein|nr:EF-hand domain-containing protein [Desulfovibrio sp.]
MVNFFIIGKTRVDIFSKNAVSNALAALCLCAAFVTAMLWEISPVRAGQEMSRQGVEERFAAMDADSNGKVNREEFLAAHPAMKDEAFAAIDADGDGVLVIKEWKDFAAGHGMGGAMPPVPSSGTEGASSAGKDAPGLSDKPPSLLMPPGNSR